MVLIKEDCEKSLLFIDEKCTAWGKEEQDEFIKVKRLFGQLIKERFYPEACTLEELKPNMWVWDDRLKTCFLIKEINNNCEWPIVVYRNHLGNELDGLKFEENRFFPPTKAMINQ